MSGISLSAFYLTLDFVHQVQNDTLYLGAFEANPGFWEAQPGFAFGLFDLNMESYLPYLEAIHRQPRNKFQADSMEFRRLPMLDSVGHKTVICGPESFTPDSMPLFGETPEVSTFLGGDPRCRKALRMMPVK